MLRVVDHSHHHLGRPAPTLCREEHEIRSCASLPPDRTLGSSPLSGRASLTTALTPRLLQIAGVWAASILTPVLAKLAPALAGPMTCIGQRLRILIESVGSQSTVPFETGNGSRVLRRRRVGEAAADGLDGAPSPLTHPASGPGWSPRLLHLAATCRCLTDADRCNDALSLKQSIDLERSLSPNHARTT